MFDHGRQPRRGVGAGEGRAGLEVDWPMAGKPVKL
jgi:hypothetical protein